MKKIIYIFSFLLFAFCCYAQNVQISDVEYKNYLNNQLILESNLKRQVNTALNNIELNNNEFISLSGKLSSNKELLNYNIKALNITDEKANLIIKKLNDAKLVFNYIPDVYNPNIIYDKFDLYIGAKPQYEINKDFIVLFNLTNEKLKQNEKDNLYKEKMDEYYSELYYKFYPEFIKIKKEYEIPDNKMLAVQLSIDKMGNLLSVNIINSIDEKTDNYMLSVIKNVFPFKKLPNSCNFSAYNLIFAFDDIVTSRIKDNVKNNLYFVSNYDMAISITQNKRGDIISTKILKSSNKNSIDEEIIKVVKKTNLIEYLKKNYTKEKYENNLYVRSAIMGKEWKFNAFIQDKNDNTTQTPINWQEYIVQIEQQAKKNWRANVYKYKNHKVVVLIVLNKEGQLINRSIISSSGIKEADDAILKSIDEGAPYPKFPQGFKGNILPIELTFDCSLKNMVNQSLNQSNNTNSLKSKYYELMQKTSQQQTYRPSVNSFNSNQDLLLKIKEKSENKK